MAEIECDCQEFCDICWNSRTRTHIKKNQHFNGCNSTIKIDTNKTELGKCILAKLIIIYQTN